MIKIKTIYRIRRNISKYMYLRFNFYYNKVTLGDLISILFRIRREVINWA
ncbi:MAG: hypothetical protein BAJALOKI2v1_960008 [Promethearchaeota archaeon]|nr:MAG: hypothetical protein BAJALOKI2v1_960008 [Candidatus Lokiarchaeota archaeon]